MRRKVTVDDWSPSEYPAWYTYKPKARTMHYVLSEVRVPNYSGVTTQASPDNVRSVRDTDGKLRLFARVPFEGLLIFRRDPYRR